MSIAVPTSSPVAALTIAARRSPLARLQAELVGTALQTTQPSLSLQYQFSASLGDRRADDPLWQMPEKGVFTADLRQTLLAGQCDLVVHSWKDLPIEESAATVIAATLPRADQRDVLLVNAERWSAARGAFERFTVLTSAPRRAHNLRDVLPAALPAQIEQLEFKPVRGNIQTRVAKLFSENANGLIVAKAALDRLLETTDEQYATERAALRAWLQCCHWMVLPLRLNPTAAAQGALAIEVKRRDAKLIEWLQAVNCSETQAAVERERAILKAYGGGCHQAMGVSVLRRAYGEIIFLRGLDAAGQAITQQAKLQPLRPRPPKVARKKLWPLERTQSDWFTRLPLIVPQPAGEPPLWIAKADALPRDWQLSPTQRVWASGWETWRKLATRGVWVNGCAEGLGEHEPIRLESLHGAPLEWRKLTHAASHTDSPMTVLATYELKPRAAESQPNTLNQAEYFFWSSGSAFQHALTLQPDLPRRTHFCGPGVTQQALRAVGIEPHLCLDHEAWLLEMG